MERLFHSLEVLECEATETTLLCYVDGDSRLFERVRTYVAASKFKDPKCLHRGSKNPGPLHGLLDRRWRITQIKNESRDLIPDCTYVFSIEDDTIVPPHALSQLLMDYAAHPYAGFVQGVELGRWGVPYVGAWKADDPYEPTKIESVMPPDVRDGTAEIDAGGFYCYLTKRETYVKHEYATFDNNTLGPDVNFGISLRREGYQNYVDWRVSCEHKTRGGGSVSLGNTTPRLVSMVKHGERWTQTIG